MSKTEYFTKQRLEQLNKTISDRDRHILNSLQQCKYLTTLQIARLHFSSSLNSRAAVRAASRSLGKLREYNLINALQRRIGGVRAGSGSFVWALAPGGFKLLNLRSSQTQSRKHFHEPTSRFLTHTLRISEAYLQLLDICIQNEITLAQIQFEPECWRQYALGSGKSQILKPDMYAVIKGGGYQDYYFIEIDCDTENVARVIDKCERYIKYLHSGTEQKQSDLFPYVVWIVPNEKRKISVKKHLHMQFKIRADLFIVILPDELEILIKEGVPEYIRRHKKNNELHHPKANTILISGKEN